VSATRRTEKHHASQEAEYVIRDLPAVRRAGCFEIMELESFEEQGHELQHQHYGHKVMYVANVLPILQQAANPDHQLDTESQANEERPAMQPSSSSPVRAWTITMNRMQLPTMWAKMTRPLTDSFEFYHPIPR